MRSIGTPQISSMRSQIVARGLRQSPSAPHADRALAPARHLLVDRLAFGELFGAERQDVAAARPPRDSRRRAAASPCRRARRAWSRTSPDTPLIWIERLQRRGVEPAAAPRPPGRRAELVAARGELPPDVVVELGGKRPGAHARGVGLGDAQHVMQRLRARRRCRPQPRPRRSCSR